MHHVTVKPRNWSKKRLKMKTDSSGQTFVYPKFTFEEGQLCVSEGRASTSRFLQDGRMVVLAAAAISHCERLLFRVSTRRLLLRLLLRQHIVRWIELIFGRVLVFVDVAVHRSAVLVVVICPTSSKGVT